MEKAAPPAGAPPPPTRRVQRRHTPATGAHARLRERGGRGRPGGGGGGRVPLPSDRHPPPWCVVVWRWAVGGSHRRRRGRQRLPPTALPTAGRGRWVGGRQTRGGARAVGWPRRRRRAGWASASPASAVPPCPVGYKSPPPPLGVTRPAAASATPTPSPPARPRSTPLVHPFHPSPPPLGRRRVHHLRRPSRPPPPAAAPLYPPTPRPPSPRWATPAHQRRPR